MLMAMPLRHLRRYLSLHPLQRLQRWFVQKTPYPLVMTNSLLLNMPIEIVDFPSYKMVDLSIVMLVYQRVSFGKMEKPTGSC